MKKLLLLLLCYAFTQCSVDKTIVSISEEEKAVLFEFQQLTSDHKMQLSDKNEPGEPLNLCLTFVEKKNNKAVPFQLIKLYHTTTNGDYEPSDPTDESTAKLNGVATSDESGRIYVSTILPGDYGSSTDNRHIHTTVTGARPEAYDIGFKQYSTYMSRRFSAGSDQHFLADLKRTTDSTLVCFVTIEVKI